MLLLWLWFLAWLSISVIKLHLQRKATKSMSTSATALADLNQALQDIAQSIADMTAAVQKAVNQITLNNGVDPVAVEAAAKSIEQIVNAVKADTQQLVNSLPTTPPPAQVAVSVSPTSASVAPSATQQFSATVTGSTNTAVLWSVAPGGAGGTIDGTSGLYTAPASTGTDTVVATSQADPTKSQSASVTIA